MRETFGVGLSDLGGAVIWGEALTLLEGAAADTSTHLGAELAGWAYPASMPQLLQLAASVSEKSLRKIMPWSPDMQARRGALPEEIAAAQAELEAGIVFAQ